jgi:hypothetical protein
MGQVRYISQRIVPIVGQGNAWTGVRIGIGKQEVLTLVPGLYRRALVSNMFGVANPRVVELSGRGP